MTKVKVSYLHPTELMKLLHQADGKDSNLLHQGLAAKVKAQPKLELNQFLVSLKPQIEASQKGVIIALDGVTDPHNIGAVIRVAEGLGALGLLLPKHKSGKITPTTIKVASGAVEHLPIVEVVNLTKALQKCKEIGFWVLGSDCESDTPVFFEHDYSNTPIVLVMGSEGTGMREGIRNQCDFFGHIPLKGHVQSLNIATATAIMAYEIIKQQQ
jgi:23S rRNA (guanosine2251-2'-O)-methyltransferase